MGMFGGGADEGILGLFEKETSPLLPMEGWIPGVLETLSTMTESSLLSSGGGEKVQIYLPVSLPSTS